MPPVPAIRAPNVLDLLPEDQAEIFHTPDCTVHLWRPARGVFASRVKGIMKPDAELALEMMMRRVAAEDQRFVAFHDWATMTDYETESRVRLTRAVLDIRKSVEEAHLLVSSRIVALGVQAANLVVKILTVHTTRATFDAALRNAVYMRRGIGQKPR
jgi:hypothetical protein